MGKRYKKIETIDDFNYLFLKEGLPAFVGIIPNLFGDVLLINESDKILYRFPGGGVRDTESVSEAAVREVLEEVGFKINSTELDFLVAFVVDDDKNDKYKYIKVFFTYDMIRGWTRAEDDEIDIAVTFSGSEEITTNVVFSRPFFNEDGSVNISSSDEQIFVSPFHLRALRVWMRKQ